MSINSRPADIDAGKGKLSLRELFTEALERYRTGVAADDAMLWSLVGEAADFGRQAYDIGLHFLKSPDLAQRVIAVDMLAMVAVKNPGAGESVARAMVNLFASESEPEVQWSALVAMGPTASHTALPVLYDYAKSVDAPLRSQAVQSISMIMKDGGETEEGVHLLIAAMEDEDREIGYWATVGVASMITIDNSAVRDALTRRLFDTDDGIRDEAIYGLSLRKDPRMRNTLEQSLMRPAPSARIFDAVEIYGSPDLVSMLEAADVANVGEERRQAIIRAIQ